MWSNAKKRGFLAVTVHFITRDSDTKRLVYHAELGAFRYIRGTHSGRVMAEHFRDIVKELGIAGKVSFISSEDQ